MVATCSDMLLIVGVAFFGFPYPGPVAGGTGMGGSGARCSRPRWLIMLVAAVISIGLGTGTGILVAPRQSGPADTVRRFFTAIRDGNARAALAELRDPPSDTRFITDAVLKQAHASYPLSDISVTPTSTTAVPVVYRLNQDTIADTVSVAQVGDRYKIVSSLNKGGISLGSQRRNGLTMMLAGVEVTTDQVFLLPGIYPITSSSSLLTFGRSGQVAVPRLQDSPQPSDFAVQLTPHGRDRVVKAVRDSLSACLAQRSYTPVGCPFRYTQPVAAPDTATWSIPSPPTDQQIQIKPSAADLTTSTVEVTLPSLRLTFPPGSSPDALDLGRLSAIGRVDLLVADPKIVWTS